jgi:hypothetical protein
MEDRQIDDLFQKGLENEGVFSNAPRQWDEVDQRLNQSKRRAMWPFYFGSVFLLVLTSIFVSNSLDTKKQTIDVNKSKEIDPPIDNTSLISKDQLELLNKKKTNVVFSKKEILNQPNKSNNSLENIFVIKDKIDSRPINNLHLHQSTLRNAEENTSTKNTLSLGRDNDITPIHNLLLINIEDKIENKSIIHGKSEIYTKEGNISVINILPLPQRYLQVFNDSSLEMGLANIDFSKNKTNLSFTFNMGYRKEIIANDLLIDKTKASLFVGVDVNTSSRMGLGVSYSHATINRFTSDLPTFNRIVPNASPIYNKIKDIGLNYKAAALDLSLNYMIIRKTWINTTLMAGIQMSNRYEGTIAYVTDNIYNPETILVKINPHPFKISDVLIGLNLRVPLKYNFGLDLRYKYYMPMNESVYQWHNRHCIQVGINYTL